MPEHTQVSNIRGASEEPPEHIMSIARQAASAIHKVLSDPAYNCFLFGSWASGTARVRSDVDIGIEGPLPVDAGRMALIRDAMDRLPTLYAVDVVDFGGLSPEIRESFKTSSVRLGLP